MEAVIRLNDDGLVADLQSVLGDSATYRAGMHNFDGHQEPVILVDMGAWPRMAVADRKGRREVYARASDVMGNLSFKPIICGTNAEVAEKLSGIKARFAK